MNRGTFLQSFGHIAEAPGGIDRLRGMVLDLAVHGQLGTQDDADEPADALLTRISDERARLIASGDARRVKSLAAVAEAETFGVPCGWSWTRFGNLFSRVGAGSTPTGGAKAYVDAGVMFLRSQNVHNNGLVLDGVAHISRAVHEKMYGTWVQGGDILLNITGASIGRSAIVPTDGWTTANVNQHVSVLRPVAPETTEYLHALIVSPYFQRLIAASSPGASREGLAIKRMEVFPVPLPPAAEQRRIVERIDELMALCDDLELQQVTRAELHAALNAATLRRVTEANTAADLRASVQAFADSINLHLAAGEGDLAALNRVRQTILDLAVRGCLTPRNPTDEPASQLVEGLKASEGARPRRGRRSALSSLSVSSDIPFAVPDTWQWSRLDEICDSRLGKMLDDRKNTGLPRPYLRNTNVQWGRFSLEDIKEIRLEDGELEEYSLRDGDLLVVEGGEPARCAIWDSSLADGVMIFQKALHRVRPREGVSARYIALVLRNGVDSGRIADLFTGSTIKHLTGEKLKSLLVPLPPSAEQHRIVDRVAELFAVCDDLEAQLSAARSLRSDVAASVVAHALSGPRAAR